MYLVRVWTNAKFCSPTRPSWHSRERLIYEVTKMLCMNARKMNVAIGQDLLGMQVVELGKDSCGRSMRSAPPRSTRGLLSARRVLVQSSSCSVRWSCIDGIILMKEKGDGDTSHPNPSS